MRAAKIAGDHWSDTDSPGDRSRRGDSNHKDPTGRGADSWGVRFHGPYSLRSVPHYLHREDTVNGLWLAATGLALLVVPWLFVSWVPVPEDVPSVLVPAVSVVSTLWMVGWPLLAVPVLSLAGAGILVTLVAHLLSDWLVIGPHNRLLAHPANPRARDALRVVVTARQPGPAMSGKPNARRPLPELLVTLEREREALNLRLEGMSYQQIGDTQGCTASTASNRVSRAIRDYIPKETRDAARSLAAERITAMIRWNLTLVWDPTQDRDDQFKAQAMLHRWMEREAKLLGLDTPVVVELTQRGSELDAEIEALMAQLVRPVPPAPAGHRPPPPMPGTNGNGAPTNGHHPNGAGPA